MFIKCNKYVQYYTNNKLILPILIPIINEMLLCIVVFYARAPHDARCFSIGFYFIGKVNGRLRVSEGAIFAKDDGKSGEGDNDQDQGTRGGPGMGLYIYIYIYA